MRSTVNAPGLSLAPGRRPVRVAFVHAATLIEPVTRDVLRTAVVARPSRAFTTKGRLLTVMVATLGAMLSSAAPSSAAGCSPDNVRVVIQHTPGEVWAIAGLYYCEGRYRASMHLQRERGWWPHYWEDLRSQHGTWEAGKSGWLQFRCRGEGHHTYRILMSGRTVGGKPWSRSAEMRAEC